MPEPITLARSSTIRATLAQILGWLIAVAFIAPSQIHYIREMARSGGGWFGWLFAIGLDSTLFFVLLLAGPLFWFWSRRTNDKTARTYGFFDSWFGSATKPSAADDRADWRAWVLACLVAVASLVTSWGIAQTRVGGQLNLRFGDLPPAYHDEYSYLFQAKTFLAGRLSYPSHPTMPELFDQMHVVNEGRFASRYFPGTGAWMAPFLAAGHPYWGHWLAGAFSAMLTFWAGRELGGNGVGFLAGALTALSPGLGLFSNLLLAHHPTLVGLSLFVFLFLRMQRTGRTRDFVFCGCGLSFAMLCRPMTAAGVGLPFGIWQVIQLMRNANDSQIPMTLIDRLRRTLALGAPVAAGLIYLLFVNHAITGNAFVSPYQLYTDTYTPRHVYGFHNVARGETKLGPKVIDNYDRWAENLTLKLARHNLRDRYLAATHWTFSLPLLSGGAVVFLLLCCGKDRRWLLIPLAIISLFAVHVPYWFVGIMNWHYVFEAAPLWLLLFAGASVWLIGVWKQERRRLMPIWWTSLIAIQVAVTFGSTEPGSLHAAVNEAAFSRIRYEQFQQRISRLRSATTSKILLLVEADPADRSIDYVVNTPDLSGDLLRGRFRPGITDISQVHANFAAPEWECWVYRVKEQSLERLPMERR
ncbi:MAG: ArnT family glycosyltransferase [Planctomycetaceae bacterium]